MNEKIRGGLYGLLIGDAVGVSYEFNLPEQLPAFDEIDMQPPAGFLKTYPDVPVGTWSDDGAQALCLLASLLKHNAFNKTDFLRRIHNWSRAGYLAVDRKVFDIGVQTKQALERYVNMDSYDTMGNTDEYSNGNGSLMRCLPLALWYQGDESTLIHISFEQSHLTHAHLRSKLCCAFYCLWAKQLLNDVEVNHAWDNALEKLKSHFQHDDDAMLEINQHIFMADPFQIKGSGYVVDSLYSAKFALQQSNYKDVIKTAISLGNDTDTTACIAGGLAGIIYGLGGIPNDWVSQLRGKDLLEPIKLNLIKHLAL